jgi:hypothetical protein
VFIVGEFFTSGCALIATLRAAFQHVFRQRAVASAQSRTCFAALSTISTELGSRVVLSLAIGDHLEAVVEAAIAFELASRTDLGTFHHHFVLLMFISERNGWRDDRQCKGSKQGLDLGHRKTSLGMEGYKPRTVRSNKCHPCSLCSETPKNAVASSISLRCGKF